jgi:hypothetical protein
MVRTGLVTVSDIESVLDVVADMLADGAPSRYATTAAALTALASNGSSAACGSAWCFR